MIRDECNCHVCWYIDDSREILLPLGIQFKNNIDVKKVKRNVVKSVCENHHSYMPTKRHSSVVDHGIYMKDRLVGIVSYASPLFSDGLGDVPSENIMEVARVCIVPNMPNLASCGMAKSQDKFKKEAARKYKTRMLVTYVKDGYEGSMFKALRGKGWEYDGISQGSEKKISGRGPNREIYADNKKRWICHLNIEHYESIPPSEVSW